MDLFPTAYFGSISYFKSLCKADNPCIEAKEHFIKQTCRTRCTILGANGLQHLSIPVIRKNGSKTAIDEVEVSTIEKWQKIHWKSIESAYASSAYFDAYDLEIKALIFSNEINLLNFNTAITQTVLQLLDIELEISRTLNYSAAVAAHNFLAHDFEAQGPTPPYFQVFSDGQHFQSNLSILDLLFNEGPIARKWLLQD